MEGPHDPQHPGQDAGAPQPEAQDGDLHALLERLLGQGDVRPSEPGAGDDLWPDVFASAALTFLSWVTSGSLGAASLSGQPRNATTDRSSVTATSVTTAKTVIVADDTAFVRDRFATALLGAGHTALTVKSAVELLARVRADLARIDLIVLDLRLPHAAGVDLVRSIRKLDGGRLPILVFSGTIATAEEVRDLAALGTHLRAHRLVVDQIHQTVLPLVFGADQEPGHTVNY